MFDAASNFYAKAAKTSPFDRSIKRKLGFSLLYSYKNDTAIDVLKNILTLKDVDKNEEMTGREKTFLKGAIYARRKEYDKAISLFLCDDSDEAYLRLAHAYLETDDITKALYYCEMACRKRKYDFSTHELLAMFYSRIGIFTDAYELMRKSQNMEEERKVS